MTYERINFVNQDVEYPRRYNMKYADGTVKVVTMANNFGDGILGTERNATNMNIMDEGIANSATIDLDNLSSAGTLVLAAKQDNITAGDNIRITDSVKINALSSAKAGSETSVPATEGIVSTDLANISKDGKSLIVETSFPSNSYIDLTIGASGTSYTAPNDGWFSIVSSVSNKTSNYTAYAELYNTSGSTVLGCFLLGSYSYSTGGALIPASAGMIIKVYYGTSVTMTSMKFIYVGLSEINLDDFFL